MSEVGHPACVSYQPQRVRPDDVESDDHRGARKAGRGLLWLLIGVAIVVVLVAIFLIGPFGLVIVLPALLVIWMVSGAASGGPAAGA